MRVCHVITGLRSGGAENQLEMLVGRSRHEAEVCALYNADGAVGQRLSRAGVAVHDLGMRSNRQVAKILELARLLRRGRYDAVHLHLYRATVYGRVAARLAGVPAVLTTEHSLGETQIEGRPKGGLVRGLYLATEPLSRVTVAVSPAVGRRLAAYGVPEDKLHLVPNGLDFSRYEAAAQAGAGARARLRLGVPAGAFVVGAVGRLHAGKRLDLVLEACAPEEDSTVVLAGDGPDRDRLERLAADLGMAHRTIFAGETGDVRGILSALDLFVSLSREETFGLSVLEAIAARRRVLADACPALDAFDAAGAGTAAPGVRRLVRGAGGEAAQEEVRGAIRDARSGAMPMSRASKALRDAYDAAAVAERIDGLYESLLAGAQAERATSPVVGEPRTRKATARRG